MSFGKVAMGYEGHVRFFFSNLPFVGLSGLEFPFWNRSSSLAAKGFRMTVNDLPVAGVALVFPTLTLRAQERSERGPRALPTIARHSLFE